MEGECSMAEEEQEPMIGVPKNPESSFTGNTFTLPRLVLHGVSSLVISVKCTKVGTKETKDGDQDFQTLTVKVVRQALEEE